MDGAGGERIQSKEGIQRELVLVVFELLAGGASLQAAERE